MRLRQPADECIKTEGLKDVRDLYCNDGVALIAERGSRGILSFFRFKFDPRSLSHQQFALPVKMFCSAVTMRVQITLTYDGVTIHTYGTATELARYPPDVTRLGPIVVLGHEVVLFLRHVKHLEPGKYV